MKNKLLFLLLLSNLSFAGTITNATINTGDGGNSTFNKGGNGGNVYNQKFYETTDDNIVNLGKGGTSTFDKNGANGKIFIDNQYLDIKKCFNKLNISYDPKNLNKEKILLLNNKNLKINNKIISIDKCLTKKNNGK